MSYDTTSPDYYGGQNDANIVVFEGKKIYPVVDEKTGVTTWYERKGTGLADAFVNDIKLGSVTPPSKTFVPHEGIEGPLGYLWPDGFSDVFNSPEQQKKFLDPLFQAQLRKKANEVITRENVEEKGQDAEEAQTNANTLQQNNNGSDAPPEPTADSVTKEALDDITIKEKAKTRRSFGDFRYPIDMDPNQDVMKFTMLKYETKDLMSDGSFGFGNRDRVGPEGGARATGTVVLPIQSGIKDQNGADWGDNKLNALQVAKASIALGLMGDDAESNALDKIGKAVSGNSDAAKEAIKVAFAQKAANVTGLIQRTKGATINPNLELLFNAPTLRPFTFSFKLSARSKDEAAEIIKIIRFFKQGMAPIRTESNLFLLAPHTFQIHYLLRGTGEHPYIGKMKECALTSMSTDYTPENNYSTLRDGFMTSYTITMEFKELEPIFNDDYEELKYAQQKFATFREDPVENAKLQEDFNKLPEDIGF